jgi:hypothetical protein
MESLAISQTDNKPTMDSREFADLLVNMVAEKKAKGSNFTASQSNHRTLTIS